MHDEQTPEDGYNASGDPSENGNENDINEQDTESANMPETPNDPPTTKPLKAALQRAQSNLNGDEKIPKPDDDLDAVEVLEGDGDAEKANGLGLAKDKGLRVDRETRQALRDVQRHMLLSQVSMGAEHRTLDRVETVYHPSNPLDSLNYVTPRRKTAWISTEQIENGINFLRERGRTPRVMFIEGLLPPLFARNLSSLNLEVETETPLMVYLRDGLHGQAPPEVKEPSPSPSLRVEIVSDLREVEVWWYVWRNAYYDVFTLGVEPIFVGRDMASLAMGKHIDIIIYRENLPFGAARVTVHEDTAHIVTVAIFKEMRTPDLVRLVKQMAMYEALQRGCRLVFAPGETPEERQINRSLGFMDFGSVVCYAAKRSKSVFVDADDLNKPLAQPILNLKRKLNA